MATNKEDAWAGILALTDKTQENINLVLNHYGFDRYERKVKFLEEQLGINSEKEGASMKDRFTIICEYIKETSPKKVKKPAAKKADENIEKLSKMFGVPAEQIIPVPKGATRSDIADMMKAAFEKMREEDKREEDEYTVDESDVDFKMTLLEMLNDFNDDERERILNTIARLHKKYEISPQERAFRQVCDGLGIDYNDRRARVLFETGVSFGKRG